MVPLKSFLLWGLLIHVWGSRGNGICVYICVKTFIQEDSGASLLAILSIIPVTFKELNRLIRKWEVFRLCVKGNVGFFPLTNDQEKDGRFL